MTHTIAIRGGKIFDPGSGWDGIEKDLFIADGRLVDRLANVSRVIDAAGLAVTPGAIDMRSFVAGYGRNYLRLWGALPSPRELADSYARLGYTHIHEPNLTVATANYVHQELAAIPILDTSASLTINLRDFDTWLRDASNFPAVCSAWSCLLEHSRALNFRLVEPFIKYRQDYLFHRTLSGAAILEILARLLESSASPIFMEATPELLAAALPNHQGLHLAALGPALQNPELLEKACRHLENGLSADMGLLPVIQPPGQSFLPVKIDLGWFQPFDLNKPTAAAVSRRALHLAVNGPREKLAFSVADQIQAPVSGYPQLFSCLGNLPYNSAALPYTFNEWIRSTRTLPAQCLGLPDKGHLRPGARADIALYDLHGSENWPDSIQNCRMLLKRGELVVENFKVVNYQVAKTCYYRQTGISANDMVKAVCRSHSFRPENLLVQSQSNVEWQQVS